MKGYTNFLGGLKNRGCKAFKGPVTEGCLIVIMVGSSYIDLLANIDVHLFMQIF